MAKENNPIPIVFMTAHGDIPMSVEAMKAGAVDFLPKPFRDQDMLQAVSRAIESDRKRREDEQAIGTVRSRYETLTRRERDVLALVAAGLMNKQIAAESGIAEQTVKIHRARMMQKMAAKSVVDLARMAQMLGFRGSRTPP